MAGFAFLFAPTAFAHVGPTPAFAATIAGTLRLLTRADTWLIVLAAAITVFAQLESPRRGALVVAALGLMLVFGFVETQWIIPRMELTPLQTPAYQALHKQSSTIYAIVLLLGLTSFVLTASPKRS